MRNTKNLMLALLILVSILAEGQSQASEYCWRDAITREDGTFPFCPESTERIGLFCYSKCPPNFKRFGFDCHSICPAGLEDQGLFCRKTEYGRGTGYPWEVTDTILKNRGLERCEKVEGKGKCEWSGAIAYPKCKPGFYAFGCCICRPNAPDCKALGLNSGVDLSCAKKIIIGDPYTGDCPKGKEKSGGVCYYPCKTGWEPYGSKCWGPVPKNWVKCGMGAAKTNLKCVSQTFSQVISVVNIALNIATLGIAGQVTGAITKVQKLTRIRELTNQVKNIVSQGAKIGSAAANTVRALDDAVKVASSRESDLYMEDIVRLSAELASLVDPTGVSNAIASYTFPTCVKMFPNLAKTRTVGIRKWQN